MLTDADFGLEAFLAEGPDGPEIDVGLKFTRDGQFDDLRLVRLEEKMQGLQQMVQDRFVPVQEEVVMRSRSLPSCLARERVADQICVFRYREEGLWERIILPIIPHIIHHIWSPPTFMHLIDLALYGNVQKNCQPHPTHWTREGLIVF